MKKILMFSMLILSVFLVGCGESSAFENNSEKISAEKENLPSKTLVIYFSHTHRTEAVAKKIQQELNADIFEIVPEKPYPAEYHAATEVAKQEQKDDARPAIKNLPNLDGYDKIILGYPIWWYDTPMIIKTFLESYDFSGKKIIPFCTSAGNDLTGKENLIPQYAKGATIGQGIGIKGKRCQDEPDSVQKEVLQWLENLNL